MEDGGGGGGGGQYCRAPMSDNVSTSLSSAEKEQNIYISY